MKKKLPLGYEDYSQSFEKNPHFKHLILELETQPEERKEKHVKVRVFWKQKLVGEMFLIINN